MRADAIAAIVSTAIKHVVAPLVTEIADLKARIHVVEHAPPVVPLAGKDGAPGPPGPEGPPGRDGLGFDDLDVALSDRTLTLAFRRGADEKTFPIVLPFPRYRGEFATGTAYEPGDVIRHGGSAWHCAAPTSRPPSIEAGGPEWQLMVRRGRDGKRA